MDLLLLSLIFRIAYFPESESLCLRYNHTHIGKFDVLAKQAGRDPYGVSVPISAQAFFL
jgi:hypothetical protein